MAGAEGGGHDAGAETRGGAETPTGGERKTAGGERSHQKRGTEKKCEYMKVGVLMTSILIDHILFV